MKASDIRPDDAMKGQQTAMEADIAMLLTHREDFVDVACPACESELAAHEFDRKGFSYWRCKHCETVYNNPRPTPEILAALYSNSEVYKYWSRNVYEVSAENRRKLLFRPRAEMLVQRCRNAGLTGGAMLEVGASQGLFCEEVAALGLFDSVIAIEPTPDQAQVCRQKGIEVHELSYEKLRLKSKLNAIASFETIEHLFSPKAFMEWAHGNLRPGGFLMLTCPNIRGFETLVLGQNSGAVDHEHLNYFSPDSFRLLAAKTGFTDVQITTPGKLDVEIVRNALADGIVDLETLGPFIATLITDKNKQTARLFQKFLQESCLSSNMMILARAGH
ncbi:MAG: class I SAM-dependent methyltransferase [Proteobacteria bacterium]|nr:class I SAM-dependent methyltransferase [Pseudomonadota bacterium]